MTLVIDAEPELMTQLEAAATEAGLPVAELARGLLRKQMLLEKSDRSGRASEAVQTANSVTSTPSTTPIHDPFRGMFADEPELMAEIVEEAMRTREERPLRTGDG